MSRTERLSKQMARENAEKILESDYKCLLVATENGMMYEGTGVDFLALLSTIIDSAYTKLQLPKESVEYACELGLKGKDEKGTNKRSEVKEKLMELLDLM